MKILLTGATGFLGSHLLERLLNEGCEVCILKRSFSDVWRIAPLLDRVRFIDSDQEPMQGLLNRYGPFDVIIHAATVYGNDGEDIDNIFQGNVVFPLQLIEQAVQQGCSLFLNADSFFCQDQGQDYSYLKDYTLSKQQLHAWGQRYAMAEKIRFINMRLFHVYGPKDNSSKFCMNIVQRLLNEEGEIALTDGLQRRDFVHVLDVVEAFWVCLKQIESQYYQHFEVGKGESYSIRQFVEKAHCLSRSEAILNFGAMPQRAGEFVDSIADITDLKTLGWEPNISLDDGIKTLIDAALNRKE